MIPVRPPLPKTRTEELPYKLKCTLIGKMYNHRFTVWVGHSRFIWWKFYRSNK